MNMTFKEAQDLLDSWVDTEKLLVALECVETKGGDLNAPRNATAIGDNGKAKGIYQIHQKYIDDVNTTYHTQYTHDAAFIPNLARLIVVGYLARWGLNYKKNYAKNPSYEILMRCHNGGPRGYDWIYTEIYWNKCKTVLRILGVTI